MARRCPTCDDQKLQPLKAGDIELDECVRCGGLWFDKGELELFPNRPSTKVFLTVARHAPGRCLRGHSVPRAMARCPRCEAPPSKCPACGFRLSNVATPTCAIDICAKCEGAWLDIGELAALEGVKGPLQARAEKAQSAASSRPKAKPGQGHWEVAAPSSNPSPAKDAWSAPGQYGRLLTNSPGTFKKPFHCALCQCLLGVEESWAYEGELYCASCRPEEAISGKTLPQDPILVPEHRWMAGAEGEVAPRPEWAGALDELPSIVLAVLDAIAELLAGML